MADGGGWFFFGTLDPDPRAPIEEHGWICRRCFRELCSQGGEVLDPRHYGADRCGSCGQPLPVTLGRRERAVMVN